jgi:hypothetical protein
MQRGKLTTMKTTPFVRAQISWTIFLFALFGILELGGDLNLAVFYLSAIIGYFSYRFLPHIGFSQPYWMVEVMLALGAVYIFSRFLLGADG